MKYFDPNIVTLKSKSYDPKCVRVRTNFGIPGNLQLNILDPKREPNEETLQNYSARLKYISPKITTLFQKIKELDEADKKNHGKLFKHFIFTDIRSALYGAKIVGSAFINEGYVCGYHTEIKYNNAKAKTKKQKGGDDDNEEDEEAEEIDGEDGPPALIIKYGPLKLKSSQELHKSKYNNFYVLSSGGIYDQPIKRDTKKQILANFNARPDNIYGENIRFIIMDSGYKEGIDLFDIKYIHIFEPQTTLADLKQVIGRGTRLCGQKGLDFHPKRGWDLDVYIYDLNIAEYLQPLFNGSKTAFELYLKSKGQDVALFNFQSVLQETAIESAVDYELNKNINNYAAEPEEEEISLKLTNSHTHMGGERTHTETNDNLYALTRKLNHETMRNHINKHFGRFKWDKIKVENLCDENKKGGGVGTKITYTKTQDFIKHYFRPENYIRGMLLWHSVGTGKTCTAVATASASFEEQGYTILWVTRTTLVNDIWKNMFSMVCNEQLRKNMDGDKANYPDKLTEQRRLLSKSWRIPPMSYKQFTNLVAKKNKFYETLVKINGADDPLRKTLLIIDEAHKLYGESDLSTIEKPNMEQLHKALMTSYAVSGRDSVKLLLMTATPITTNPMELIQMLNLCRPIDEQLPFLFDAFKMEYLNDEGQFATQHKREQFMDQIAGQISYLDRSSDVRQFSQPKIHYVNTNIIADKNILKENAQADLKKLARIEVDKLKAEKTNHMKAIRENRQYLAKTKKHFKKMIGKLDLPNRFTARKYATKAKKEITDEIKQYIAELKMELSDENQKHKDDMEDIDEKVRMVKAKAANLKPVGVEGKDANFKLTPYYTITHKCASTDKKLSVDKYARQQLEHVPRVEQLRHTIEGIKATQKTQAQVFGEKMEVLKKKLAHDRKMIMQKHKGTQMATTKMNALRALYNRITKKERENLNELNSKWNAEIKAAENKIKQYRKVVTKKVKGNLKNVTMKLKADKKAEKLAEKERKKQEKDNDIVLRDNHVEKEKQLLDNADMIIQNIQNEENDIFDAKEAKEQAKEQAKADKAKAKEQAKADKEKAKEQAKADKERAKKEKELEKELAKAEKEKQKLEKARAKAK